jgi:hypothetical protein
LRRDQIGFGAGYRRGDALIFEAQIPPGLIVVFRLDFSGEDFPAPLIDDQTERQEGDLVESLTQKDGNIGLGWRKGFEQSNLLQIFQRDGRAMVSPMAS